MLEHLFGSFLGGGASVGYDPGVRNTTVVGVVEPMPSCYPAYKNGYVWYPAAGSEYQVSTRWHKSRDEATAELEAMMQDHGYVLPKWWQYWRWKEKRLPFEGDWDK